MGQLGPDAELGLPGHVHSSECGAGRCFYATWDSPGREQELIGLQKTKIASSRNKGVYLRKDVFSFHAASISAARGVSKGVRLSPCQQHPKERWGSEDRMTEQQEE